jgi:Tol biopolymer transport system component
MRNRGIKLATKSTLFCVASVLVGCLCAAADEPSTPGLIAFSVRRWEGEYRSGDVAGGVETTPVVGSISTIRADGSQLRRVVELGRDTNAPTFSADGRWLYFQSNAAGTYQIYRCRPDGSEMRSLLSPEKVGPSWKSVYGLSAGTDGRFVFTVHDGQSGRVALANADGSNPRVIAAKEGYRYMAALSPTGDNVVCSGPAAGYRLQRITLPDEPPVTLTPDHPDSFVPQFTPDGKTIVFFRRDGDIYRVGVDGRNLQRLTEGNHHVEFRLSAQDRHGSSDPPHLSPDGKQIAYIADAEGRSTLYVINLDGTHKQVIVVRNSPCARVRWSPDGRHIAFVSVEGKYPQLFVVKAEGGEPRRITNIDGAVYFVAWQPTVPTTGSGE